MIFKIAKEAGLSLIAIATVALCGCATSEAGPGLAIHAWDGKESASLAAKWGTPGEATTLSDGSQLWVYHKPKKVTLSEQVPTKTTRKQRTEAYVVNGVTMTRQVAYEDTDYIPPASRVTTCEARITVKDGVVKSAEVKGEGCTLEDFENAEKITNAGDDISNR